MKGYAVLAFLLILTGCASSKKLMQKGDYDALINKSVKNLIKNPNSEEDAEMLDKAYKLANERDQDRVQYLKLEGNPDTWDEIFALYNRLKSRQATVRKKSCARRADRQYRPKQRINNHVAVFVLHLPAV